MRVFSATSQFYFYKMEFPAIFGVDRIPVCTAQAQPALLSMRVVSQHAFFSTGIGSMAEGLKGRFGQDPFRPEKTWTFRPKAWTIRPRMMNVSAKKDGRFGQIYI